MILLFNAKFDDGFECGHRDEIHSDASGFLIVQMEPIPPIMLSRHIRVCH